MFCHVMCSFELFYVISQAVRAEITDFLQQLWFEITRKDFVRAALQCKMHLSACLKKPTQVVKSLELNSL